MVLANRGFGNPQGILCMMTLFMAAAILFTGLLTTQASAKPLQDRLLVHHSPIDDLKHKLLDTGRLLEEQEERIRELVPPTFPSSSQEEVLPAKYPQGSSLSQFMRNIKTDPLFVLLWELHKREQYKMEGVEGHKTWKKRLEDLNNLGGSKLPLSLLEASRRGDGPKFNPTGW